MAKSKSAKKASQKSARRLLGGAQNAEAFLKNGSKSAARALKRATRQAAKLAERPPRDELRGKLWRHGRPRPRGIADPTLLVKEAVAQSKHQTYYEIVDNTEKKKKLDYLVTTNVTPPISFTFIPVGNPELTNACKEISREQDCLIFVVSHDLLSDHIYRLGYHFRSIIVDEACARTGIDLQSVRRGEKNTIRYLTRHGQPKEIHPLPGTQAEIDAEADAAIRDLFPRIPNTDRQEIIDHAFQLGQTFAGKPVVGLQEELTLSRRVQLAVIAHIRHNHTRYDKLLRETDWSTARATIEKSCLEILVKWRGDEETGRDQLDEVLREVVVISDSEDSDSEETDEDDEEELEDGEVAEDAANADVEMADVQPPAVSSNQQARLYEPYQREIVSLLSSPPPASAEVSSNISMARQRDTQTSRYRARKAQKNDQKNERKGFKRYQAWNEAISRYQKEREASFGTNHSTQAAGLYDHQPNSPLQPGNIQRHAMDQEPRLQITPRQATFRVSDVVDLTASSQGEKVMSRPTMGSSSHIQPFDSRYVGQHSVVVRDRAPLAIRPLSPPKSGLQDYLLPSIEEAPDRAVEGRTHLPDLPRQPEVRHPLALEPSSRGLTLMSNGTYRDAYGVVRNADGRRVIYIDENNQELPHKVDSAQRFAGNYIEGSASRTLPLMSGHSSTRYHHDSVNMDGRSNSKTISTPVHANNGEFYADRPVLRENQLYDDVRDSNGTRHYPGIIPRELEVSYSRPRDVIENYGRAPAERSHIVRHTSLSRFSENPQGIAHPEQFSHSSSQLRERVVYGQSDFEEPVLTAQRTGGGTVHYFEEPSMATRSHYENPLPPRRPVSATQHGPSRKPNVQYVDLDRPMNDYRRNIQDQYTSRNGADAQSGMIPVDQARPFTNERTPLHDTRSLPIRPYVNGHDYLL